MSLLVWVGLYVLQALWWLWLACGGGARVVQGAWAAIVVHQLAWRWTPDGIRLFAWLSLVVSTAWFVLGVFEPAARY